MLCPLEAERSVLGTLLLAGNCPLPTALTAEHFYTQRHQFLYLTIQELSAESRGFDVPCVLRAMVARLPRMKPQALQARQEKIRGELDLLVSEAQVSMLADHARLVVESACFRNLKARSLELQDAALRGDVVSAGRALEAAQEAFGELARLSGGPVLEVVKERAA